MLPPNASGFARYKRDHGLIDVGARSACRLRAILVSVSPWPHRYVLAGDRPRRGLGGTARGRARAAARWRRGARARSGARWRRQRRAGVGGSRRGLRGSAAQALGSARAARARRCWRVLAGRVHRRVEQHRVLAHQTAARPIDLDQESHEGLGDRIGRAHQQDVAAVLALAHLEGQRRQERRAIDAVAGEGVAAGKAGAQARSIHPGTAAIRSISAFIGSFSAEFKWISPRPSAQDEDGHNKEGTAGTPTASGEASSRTFLLPGILVGKRAKLHCAIGAWKRILTCLLHKPITISYWASIYQNLGHRNCVMCRTFPNIIGDDPKI